jgi:hypothetical protein
MITEQKANAIDQLRMACALEIIQPCFFRQMLVEYASLKGKNGIKPSRSDHE